MIFFSGRGVGSGAVKRMVGKVRGLIRGFLESPYLPPTGGVMEIKEETEPNAVSQTACKAAPRG